MPFPVNAIQIDGGSEFMAKFEWACRDLGIRLFVLPPRSPKLNGGVERANRTHTEEFYECSSGAVDSVTVTGAFIMKDQYGNTRLTDIVQLRMDTGAASKFNWDGLTAANLWRISEHIKAARFFSDNVPK